MKTLAELRSAFKFYDSETFWSRASADPAEVAAEALATFIVESRPKVKPSPVETAIKTLIDFELSAADQQAIDSKHFGIMQS